MSSNGLPFIGHSHPCNFRLFQKRDNGWGEMAFGYCWDSTSGLWEENGYLLPDLTHCVLFEVTRYSNNAGRYADGWFYPPDPPFVGWKFRDPTDGRTAPVGMECFPASNARAWDRHKRAGSFQHPDSDTGPYTIYAIQEYWFQCKICGFEKPLHPAIPIERRFEFHRKSHAGQAIWRYTFRKHDAEAYLELNRDGYVADSAGIGFGPWEGE